METEFAPEHTSKERWQRLVIVAPLVLGSYALCQWWFFPWLRAFSERAPCETVLGAPGLSVLFYGLFVGMPLFLAFMVGIALVPASWRAIKTRRYPPPSQKVYRRTKIKTGWRAVALALVPIVLVAYLAGVAAWGVGATREILAQAYAKHPNGWECASNTSLNTDAL